MRVRIQCEPKRISIQLLPDTHEERNKLQNFFWMKTEAKITSDSKGNTPYGKITLTKTYGK